MTDSIHYRQVNINRAVTPRPRWKESSSLFYSNLNNLKISYLGLLPSATKTTSLSYY